jgi:hypothetical protein
MMEGGITSMRTEGTPQGGPAVSVAVEYPADDLDRELERRGLSFCRYADDCNIYVGSKRAGERVMQASHSVSGAETEVESQRVQERSGAAVGAEVPWLQHDVAQETEAEDRATKPQAYGGENPQDAAGVLVAEA